MRMYGLRVPRFDPFRWAQKNSFETVYRPLRLAYGYFARMADGTPVVILSSTIKDPRRLNGTMRHEGGHVVTAPNGMVGLHVGSRSTMGRVAPASWAEIKGLLEAEDDERDGATIQFACSESSLLLPNKWEAAANRWCMEQFLPDDFMRKLIQRVVLAGNHLDR